jgi:hypothetical protein
LRYILTTKDGNIPHTYPYRLDPKQPDKIPYFEWRGRGPPPADIGLPGDIFLDLTPNKPALFARTEGVWFQWVGRYTTESQLIAHPHLEDRFLSVASNVGWYSISTLRKKHRDFYPELESSVGLLLMFLKLEGQRMKKNGKRDRDNDLNEEDEEEYIEAQQHVDKRSRVDNTERSKSPELLALANESASVCDVRLIFVCLRSHNSFTESQPTGENDSVHASQEQKGYPAPF